MSSRDGKGEDLKNMLMSFRIAELQTLLGACGRSRSGRKHELLGRAVSLLKSSTNAPNREKVRARILELYHQRYPPGGVEIPEIAMGNVGSLQTYPSQPYMQYPREEDDDSSSYLNRSSSQYKDVSSQKTKYSSVFHHAHNSQQLQSTSYPSTAPLHSPVPIHPDVRFIHLPFYDVIDVLIKPTSLVQKTVAGYQEMSFVYHLTPYQTQLITSSRSYSMKSILEYGVQVHLRFCLAETSCIQEDVYPPRLKVIANNKPCLIPGQPPPNAQNQEPRKPHRPINITPVNISSLQSNQISVQWTPSDLGQRYTTTVHLVKTVHCEALIQQLHNKPERSPEHTKAFITEKLRQDPDSEIALTSLKVSLCCPIGKTRMTYPCRANNCHHLQCFDGATYLQMNERKPSWVCPVCDKKAHFSELFKDGLFSSIIKQSLDCDEIVFFEDGSWRPLNEIQDPQKPLSQQLLSTPKVSSKPPPDLVDCKTPSPLTAFTPVITKCSLENNIPTEMPKLNRITKPSHQSAEEPEVEIISIDSDSDDETTILPPTMAQRITQYHHNTSDTLLPSLPLPPPSIPFQDPELQGMELYNLLPHEDRIAAAMYLDQVSILGQLTSTSLRVPSSPASVIDISDE